MRLRENKHFVGSKKNVMFILAVFMIFYIANISGEAAIRDEWEMIETEFTLEKLTYGKEQFVGITEDGYSAVSEDGYEWKKGRYLGYDDYDIVYCGNYFYALGSYYGNYISNDGISWKRIKFEASDSKVENLTYYNGKYYASINQIIYGSAGSFYGNCSYVYCSEDGKNWEYLKTDEGAMYKKTIQGKDKCLTIGGNLTSQSCDGCYSWDGVRWNYESQIISNDYYNLLDMVYGKQGFITVGEGGNIWSSTDGTNWLREKIDTNSTLEKILYCNSHYITYTYEGEIFVKNTLGSSTEWKSFWLEDSICDIAYGNGKILACSECSKVYINEVGNSTNTYLSDLEIQGGELTECFDESKMSYQVEISEADTEIQITPTLMETGSRIILQRNGREDEELCSGQKTTILLGDNISEFNLKVVAENRVTYTTYSFDVVRKEKYLVEGQMSEGGYVYGGGYAEPGERVQLIAEALEGYEFDGWMENGNLYSNEQSISIEVENNNRIFIPVFTLIQMDEINLCLETNEIYAGNDYILKVVDGNGEECECSYQLLNNYESYIFYDEEVKGDKLCVDEYEKQKFLYLKVTLNSNETIQSVYKIPVLYQPMTYFIQVECVPAEAGSVVGSGEVEEGSSLTMKAQANTGYRFAYWQLNDEIYSDKKEIVLENIYEHYYFEAIYEIAELDSIEIVKNPNKMKYFEGDTFEPEGMVIQAHYNDGKSVIVEDYSYDKEKVLSLKDEQIAISYCEGDVIKETFLVIEIMQQEQEGEDVGITPQPPVEDKEEDITPEPPAEGDDETTMQPPAEGDDETTMQPPAEDEEEDTTPEPPTEEEDGTTSQPPAEDEEEDITIQPSTNGQQKEEVSQAPTTNAGQQIPSGNQEEHSEVPQSQTNTAISYKKNEIIKKGNLTYQITKLNKKTGIVSVIKAKKNLKSVVIPEKIKINGYTFKVTKISQKAFYKQKQLKKVTIGKNIMTIGSYAFAKCSKLKQIIIKSTSIKKVEKQAFSGINKKNHVVIPKKCQKKYAKWMKKYQLHIE